MSAVYHVRNGTHQEYNAVVDSYIKCRYLRFLCVFTDIGIGISGKVGSAFVDSF